MYDLEVMRNAAKRKYTLFDGVFTLTVFESDDILDIKRYVEAIINDFGEEAMADTLLVSKDDGIIEPDELLEWLETK